MFGVAATGFAATKTDANATAATQALYANLAALQSTNATAFGQQFATWQGLNSDGSSWTGDVDRSDIKTVTGVRPAVTGWNLYHYFADYVENPTPPALGRADFRQRVKDDFNRNSIITFHWAMNNLITGGLDHDLTGVGANPSILKRAVTAGDSANTQLKSNLDDFYVMLTQLTQNDGSPIPIIFRPFHEMNATACWWENGDPAEYAAMWQYMVTYLRDTKHAHQLLYAYAPLRADTTVKYLQYWPGDGYVDICGVDKYTADWNAGFQNVWTVASGKGLVAAYTELGCHKGIGDLNPPQPTWWTSNILAAFNDSAHGGANPLWPKCAYMMTWANISINNYFTPYYSGNVYAPDFVNFINDPHMLLQPDLPPMYTTGQQSATVTLSNLSQTYNGSPRPVTVTTAPAGLGHAETYNGSGTVPTNAGSYAVVSTITDPNYTGSASGTLVVAKAAATVTLGSLNQTYDGTPRSASATTAPAGLSVNFTYNGSGTAPSAVGSYAVVGTVNDTNYAGSASGTLVISPGPTTVTFVSESANDGYVLESGKNTGVGGSFNATNAGTSALRTGDDSSNEQYKAIVSFDTSSIPDGATITAVTLRLKRGAVTGQNPFGTHGVCNVDVIGGSGFGGAVALATGDFSATAGATQVAAMGDPGSDGSWSTGALNATGLGIVNKTGHTQLRVYFATANNNDNGADFVGWYSGEAAAGNQPELVVTYQ